SALRSRPDAAGGSDSEGCCRSCLPRTGSPPSGRAAPRREGPGEQCIQTARRDVRRSPPRDERRLDQRGYWRNGAADQAGRDDDAIAAAELEEARELALRIRGPLCTP